MATSFQKKGASKILSIPGTKPSIYNFQLLTSSGIPALDALLAGGWPLGSVIIIKDDSRSGEFEDLANYSRLLLKYFLAEGVAQRHALFYGAQELSPTPFLANLPQIVTTDQAHPPQPNVQATADDHLQIAWRYKNQGGPGPQAHPGRGPKHHFNLNKVIDPSVMETIDTVQCPQPVHSDEMNGYQRLFGQIRAQLAGEKFSTQLAKADKNLLRIGLANLDSPMWMSDNEHRSGLVAFLLGLRSLMRNFLGVAMITISNDPALDTEALANLYECVDGVISLQTFDAPMRQDPLLKNYHGFLELQKVPAFNVLGPSRKSLAKYLFRSQRTKFSIEKIHLPPALGEEPPKSAAPSQPKKSISHGDIDF